MPGENKYGVEAPENYYTVLSFLYIFNPFHLYQIMAFALARTYKDGWLCECSQIIIPDYLVNSFLVNTKGLFNGLKEVLMDSSISSTLRAVNCR